MDDRSEAKHRVRQRRRLTRKVARRRARRRTWEWGTDEAPSIMTFASSTGYGCPCRSHKKGTPKTGTGCYHFSIRPAAAQRSQTRRLMRDVVAGRKEPDELLPARGGWMGRRRR